MAEDDVDQIAVVGEEEEDETRVRISSIRIFSLYCISLFYACFQV